MGRSKRGKNKNKKRNKNIKKIKKIESIHLKPEDPDNIVTEEDEDDDPPFSMAPYVSLPVPEVNFKKIRHKIPKQREIQWSDSVDMDDI